MPDAVVVVIGEPDAGRVRQGRKGDESVGRLVAAFVDIHAVARADVDEDPFELPGPVAVPQRPDRMTVSVVADRFELNIRLVTGNWSEGERGGRGLRSSAPGAGPRIDQPPRRSARHRIRAAAQPPAVR